MTSLRDIHPFALAELKKRVVLNPVSLRHPFPERPVRALGLVKVDGEAFSSEKLSRAVMFRLSLPVYMAVRSFFIRPRMEYDLPVFSCETVLMGKKRMFMVDIHRTGESAGHDDSALFDRLITIRARYPDLLKAQKTIGGEIQNVFSRAICQVRIDQALDEQALSIFKQYLGVFMELVEQARPLAGEELERAKRAFDAYLKTVIDHDPGVKGYKVLFGEKNGVSRALNIFFDR
jgi:hypothetical protein